MSIHRLLLIALASAISLLALACSSDSSGVRVQSGLGAAPPASSGSSGSSSGSVASSTAQRTDAALAPDYSKGSLVGSGLAMPYLQTGSDGLSVAGYGSASATADRAVVYLYVTSGGYTGEPKPLPSIACTPAPDSICPSPIPYPVPMTVELIQPLIDAIKRQGVSEGDIQVDLQSSGTPYGAATISALLRDVGKTDPVVSAVRNAAASHGDFQLSSINVSYALTDCSGLERQAMTAAAGDARTRARALADVLGVELGKITAASQYSYASYGPYGCGQDTFRIMESASASALPYVQQQDRQVQVSATVALTLEIR